MERRDIEIDGERFATLQAGDAARPIILCAHGFPDVPRTFAPLTARLLHAGYRVVAPWMRGYRPSPTKGPLDERTIARDLVAIADRLSPSAPVRLIGHDWGAIAAYEAIARWPARFCAVVTMAMPHPLAYLRNMSVGQLRRSAYMLGLASPFAERRVSRDDFARIDELWSAWADDRANDPRHVGEVKECLRESQLAPLGYYRAMFRDTPRLLRDAVLRSRALIRVPTLHLHGAADRCVGPETARGAERLFAAAYESAVIDDAGHFVHLDATHAVADLVIDWFVRHVERDERTTTIDA